MMLTLQVPGTVAPDDIICEVGFYIANASYIPTGEANRMAQINATALFTR